MVRLLVFILAFALITGIASSQYGGGYIVPTLKYPSIAKYIGVKHIKTDIETKIIIPEEFAKLSDVLSIKLTTNKDVDLAFVLSVPKKVDVEPNFRAYKYFEILTQSLEPVEIHGIIKFRVLKTFSDSDRISLARYDEKDGKWKLVEVSFIGEDKEYYYFESYTDEFGLFSIVEVQPVPVITPKITPTLTPIPEKTSTPKTTPEKTPTPKKKVHGFEVACGLISIAVALLLRRLVE